MAQWEELDRKKGSEEEEDGFPSKLDLSDGADEDEGWKDVEAEDETGEDVE